MAPKAKAAAAPAAEAPEAKAKAKPAKKSEEEAADDKPKVSPPDRTVFDEKCAEIQTKIAALQTEQQAFAAKIGERSHGKEEFFAKKAEIRGELDEISKNLDQLQARKEGFQKQMGDKQQEGREMRSQLTKMKKSIGYTNEGEIDQRIADIEFKLWTDTMPLKDEKKLLAEIQELKRNRPKVSKVAQLEENLDARTPAAGIKESMSSVNAEMFEWREKKRGVMERLNQLSEERKEQMGDLPKIMEEKEALGSKIKELIQQRNTLRDEFRGEEREYNAYLAEQRKIRQERQNEERNKRQAEYELRRKMREAEKLDDQPYVSEIALIEQCLLFCRNLTQSKTEQKEEAKDSIYAQDAPDGLEVITKKEDRDEFYFVPTKGKKSKSSKKGGKEGGSAKAIKHNAETFRLFDQLKLDAPITTEDVPALVEKLDGQLQMYNDKVKVWEEKREELKKAIMEGTATAEDAVEDAAKGAAAAEEEEAKAEEKTED